MLSRSDLSSFSKKIAAHIVGSGVTLRRDSSDSLVALATSETDQDSRWRDVTAVFCTGPEDRWNSVGELRVRGEHSYNHETDEDGNITSEMKVVVYVQWTGGSDLVPDARLLDRLDRVSRMTTLGIELQQEFGGSVRFLVRSAEEEKERLAKEARDLMNAKVRRMGEYPSKGLRVQGNSRRVGRDLFAGCDDGIYEVWYDDHKRQVRITLSPGSASLRRLA